MDIIEQIKQIRLEEAHEEGRAEEKLNLARNLLNNTEFDIRKIADLVDAPVSFVEKVKTGLGAK